MTSSYLLERKTIFMDLKSGLGGHLDGFIGFHFVLTIDNHG